MASSTIGLNSAGLQFRTQPFHRHAAQSNRRKLLVPSNAMKDPWKLLGVAPNATEEEIKKAHRKLVLKHHPDLAKHGDGSAAQMQFMSIQEAYELLIGRRRGKEIDNMPSTQNGWSFHDWFWKFKMERRRGGNNPPPPHMQSSSQWRQQLNGLKQKAAAKRVQEQRQNPRRRAHAAAAAATEPAMNKKQQQDDGINDLISEEDNKEVEVEEEEEINDAATHNTDDIAASEDVINTAHTFGTNNSNNSQAFIHELMDAVHILRQRHEHAVHAKTQRVTSHIINISHQLRMRLQLGSLKKVLETQGAGVAAADGKELLDHAEDTLHVEFKHAVRSMHSSPASHHVDDAGESSSLSADGSDYGEQSNHHHQQQKQHYFDAHKAKFADQESGQQRVFMQLAGLRRRASLKHELGDD